jgi:hypothetical protein
MPNMGADSTKSPAEVVSVWVPCPSASRAEQSQGPGPGVFRQYSSFSGVKTVV